MTNDCLFEKQISSVIEKAKNTMSWILRTFKTRSLVAMMTLYKSLLLPILEYCSVLWCPIDVGQIQKLEAIQELGLKSHNLKGFQFKLTVTKIITTS